MINSLIHLFSFLFSRFNTKRLNFYIPKILILCRESFESKINYLIQAAGYNVSPELFISMAVAKVKNGMNKNAPDTTSAEQNI